MKDRPWCTENNVLAEDLTGGEGEGCGREQERREEKKNEREKRGRSVITDAIFLN